MLGTPVYGVGVRGYCKRALMHSFVKEIPWMGGFHLAVPSLLLIFEIEAFDGLLVDM